MAQHTGYGLRIKTRFGLDWIGFVILSRQSGFVSKRDLGWSELDLLFIRVMGAHLPVNRTLYRNEIWTGLGLLVFRVMGASSCQSLETANV